jgi:hypothetical protein
MDESWLTHNLALLQERVHTRCLLLSQPQKPASCRYIYGAVYSCGSSSTADTPLLLLLLLLLATATLLPHPTGTTQQLPSLLLHPIPQTPRCNPLLRQHQKYCGAVQGAELAALTSRGACSLVKPPWPSWPYFPRPQVKTRPPADSTAQKASPAAICQTQDAAQM